MENFNKSYNDANRNNDALIKYNNRMHNMKNKLIRDEKRFVESVKFLNPIAQYGLIMFDSNLCTFSEQRLCWELLSPDTFNHPFDTYTKEIKKEFKDLYEYIRNYMRTFTKYNSNLMMTDPQYVERIMQLIRPNKNIIHFIKDNPKAEVDKNFVNKYSKRPETLFLYHLTCGDIETLFQFGKICAQVFLNINNIRPIVILADRSEHEILGDFFKHQCDSFSFFNISDLRKNKELLRLFEYNLNVHFSPAATNIIICTGNNISNSPSYYNKLYSILHGKKISIPHPYFGGKVFIKNRIPIVYITDSHEQYMIMTQSYKALGIKLPVNKQLSQFFHSSDWYKNMLTWMGFKWQKTKRNHGVGKFKATADEILHLFTKDLCILEESALELKDELYKAYTDYTQKRFGAEPLTPIIFRKRFAAYNDFDVIRVHNEKNRAPYYFKGVKLDMDKYNEFLKNDGPKYYNTYEGFSKHFLTLLKQEYDFQISINKDKG